MLDLKTDTLYDSRKEDEGKTFQVLQVLGMNEDLLEEWRHLCHGTIIQQEGNNIYLAKIHS